MWLVLIEKRENWREREGGGRETETERERERERERVCGLFFIFS